MQVAKRSCMGYSTATKSGRPYIVTEQYKIAITTYFNFSNVKNAEIFLNAAIAYGDRPVDLHQTVKSEEGTHIITITRFKKFNIINLLDKIKNIFTPHGTIVDVSAFKLLKKNGIYPFGLKFLFKKYNEQFENPIFLELDNKLMAMTYKECDAAYKPIIKSTELTNSALKIYNSVAKNDNVAEKNQYSGYTVSAHRQEIAEEKISSVKKFPRPTNLSTLRRFLDGTVRPFAYASQKFLPAEFNYFATNDDPRGRITRWNSALHAYDFKIEHVKGLDNGFTDALSRDFESDSEQVKLHLPVTRSQGPLIQTVRRFGRLYMLTPESNPDSEEADNESDSIGTEPVTNEH
ncbi:hypothetical protein BB561_002505 [Smittium simulii]|uniref:Uncharacterized protein n=1 Tax=Smittium simulii TaxID=133385 RepID=A0A2T9YQ46_9FUNG|nr:hypothetical protein BB561_002505 [Smittium simulii]